MGVRIPQTLLIPAFALALAGCGQEVSAPSLGPRAVEKQPIDMPVTNGSEADGPADAALVAKIATLVAAAEAGDRTFSEQYVRAETAVTRASGAAQGSEPWITAQETVTALDAARGQVRDAAGGIDALRLDPANVTVGNRNAIDQAATRVGAIDQDETRKLAALATKLG